MKVSLAIGRRGAAQAGERGDVVVVIDCLRASSTIVTALACGLRAVVPTLSEKPIRRANAVTAGERNGRKLPGFDHGNSPLEIRTHDHRGKTLYLSTTNGTPCIEMAAHGAAAVLIGCLLNARAVARASARLARERGHGITLVAAGRRGESAVEDVLGAGEIARRIDGAELCQELAREGRRTAFEVFFSSPSGQNLLALGYREDIEHCAQSDLYDLVPIYRQGEIVSSAASDDFCLSDDALRAHLHGQREPQDA